MKSEVIMIDNHGNGFSEAVEQTRHFCESCDGMSDKEILRLQLISEEMLSLARSITGEMRASFWIEGNGTEIEFHMTTQTVMDKEKRGLLIMSATSMRNEAAKGFLGKLRDVFEQAMGGKNTQRNCTKKIFTTQIITMVYPMDCSLRGSSVHGISQARILEWVAIPFSRESSRHRNQTHS